MSFLAPDKHILIHGGGREGGGGRGITPNRNMDIAFNKYSRLSSEVTVEVN
jgi:hypothetical protein